MAKTTRPKSASEVGIRKGFRSGLEQSTVADLLRRGIRDIAILYESIKIHYVRPAEAATYTPDFPLPNGIIVETKGLFEREDRKKHKQIKAQHPDLDIRFVFQNPSTRISKGSPTTYAKWCDDHGFKWAAKTVPQEWLDEPPCPVRLAAIEKAKQKG